MTFAERILNRLQNNKLVAIIIVVAVVVIAVAKFTDALEQLAGLLKRHSTVQTPSKPDETPVGPVWVVSTADPKNPDGRYFYFDASTLDGLLGHANWNKRVYLVSKQRERGFKRAVLWHSSSVPRATAHGRFLPRGEPNAWHEGESFYVVPKDQGKWRESEQ